MQIEETNPDDFEQETATEVDPDETEIDIDEPESLDDDEPDLETAKDGEEAPQTEEIEYAEIELNGKKYQVPAELKDGYLMQSDYTRKTQEVAEQRKQAEAYMAQVQQAQEFSEQEIYKRAELIGINQRLEQYKQVDWNAWQNEDPMECQRGWMEFQTLQGKAAETGQELEKAKSERTAQAQQTSAKRLQETRAFAEREIKGWTPEVDAKVTEFATKKLGFPVETLLEAYSPPVYNALYLAWVGSQALERQSTAKPAAKVQQLNPSAKVSPKGGVPARKSLSDMSVDEYADYMNKREAKQRSR
tara:strand:- start:4888 stop:5796 length:909 start_codon:yes stop_codon:yes gene_type:complete